MTDVVIDVSHYQAGLDLVKYKASGGLAVIAKASQGTTIADPSYAGFRSAATLVDLAFAAYHYLSTEDAAAQATFFLKCADPVPGGRIVCDWEADGVAAADVVAFLKAVALTRPDLELTVYSGSSAKAGIDSASSAWLAANTSLWLAQYTTGTPSWPTATWKTWSLWQYTEAGSVPGYSGAVDGSRFNGSNGNLLKWFGPTPAAPAPEPAAPSVAIAISATAGVTLTINGVAVPIPSPLTA